MVQLTRWIGGTVIVLGYGSGVGFAATPAAEPPTGGPRAQAVRVEDDAIRVDGVLDEEAWQRAPVVSSFSQVQPDEGQSASEHTEVRIAFTSSTL